MGLEIALAGRDLTEAFEELEARLGERPGFYRGTSATANFGARAPAEDEVERLRSLLDSAGIRAFFDHPRRGGAPRSRAGAAARDAAGPRGSALRFRAVAGSRFCRRPDRHCRAPQAGREQRPQAPDRVPQPADPAPVLRVVEAAPETLYHVGTLRGGQALHHVGNIVVVGDVNPGAELVATGDVVVFGRLAGVAHAGAQGEQTARVFALDLDATQLRIATFIAADSGGKRTPRPEAALVRDGRIAVVPFDQLDALGAFRS